MSEDARTVLQLATIVVMFAGGLIAAFLAPRWWPTRTHPAYLEAARRLGIHASAERADGTVDGIRVAVASVPFRVHGSVRQSYLREDRIVATAELNAPLDLELLWQSRWRYEGYLPGGARYRAPPPPPLFPTWSSREDERANQLFTQGARRAFDALVGISFRVEVTDRGVLVESRMPVHADHIVALTAGAVTLATEMLRAAEQIPASRFTQPLLDEWQRFADAHGLQIRHTPLMMWGRIQDVPVVVSALLGGEPFTRISVRGAFRQSLALGLSVRAMRTVDRVPLLGSKDIKTGDEPFDRVFLLQGKRPADVQKLFPACVRDHMRGLHARHPLRIDDHGIEVTVDGTSSSAQTFTAVEAVVALARELQHEPA